VNETEPSRARHEKPGDLVGDLVGFANELERRIMGDLKAGGMIEFRPTAVVREPAQMAHCSD
jgi:hypothetical protein